MVKQQMFSPGVFASEEEEDEDPIWKLYSTQSRECPARLRPCKIRRGQRGCKASGVIRVVLLFSTTLVHQRDIFNGVTSHVKRCEEDNGRKLRLEYEECLDVQCRDDVLEAF